MTNEDTHLDLLTVYETADLLRVSPQTVRAWTRAGRIVAARLTPSTIRYRLADVESFIAGCSGEEDTE